MQEDESARKDDEEFLDSFLPKPEGDSSSRISILSMKNSHNKTPIKKSKSKEKKEEKR